jgi:hypothetical protein
VLAVIVDDPSSKFGDATADVVLEGFVEDIGKRGEWEGAGFRAGWGGDGRYLS